MTGTGSTTFPPINQQTSGDQSPPVTVQLADGRILHVWSECGLSDDTTAMELQGRIYNADGTPSTNQFSMSSLWAVDGFNGYDWPNLDVDVLKDGKVMISYVRNTCEPGADAPIFSIIDPTKAPNTTGFFVRTDVNIAATNPSGFESPPVTTVLADGKVLFVWGNDANNLATSHMTLQARVYDPATNTFGAQTTVSTSIPYSGYNEFDWDNLSVAQLSGGRIVIGYEQSSLLSGGKQPVYGMFDVGSNLGLTTFKAVGPVLATNTSSIESPPIITALDGGGFGDGGFAAVWTRDGFSSSTNNSQIFVRIFDASGTAKTGDIQIGTRAVDGSDRFDVNNLTVEKLTSGKLVIGFVESDAVDCVSYPAFSIIDPSKQPGTEGFLVKLDTQINTSAKTTALGPPVIEALSNGNFVAVWANGDGSTNQLVYRVFDANGNPITDQTVITEANNSGVVNYDGFDWANINVVAGANGSFTASWVGFYDGSGTGVFSSGPIRPGNGIVDGTAAGDLITPTSGPNGTAYVDAEGDRIDGTLSKADTVKAGAGNDTIEGGAGNDTLLGEAGDDRFVLRLGDGADSIVGGEDGEARGDTIDSRNISSNVTVTFTANEAGRVVSGTNNETDTFREIERFELGAGNDSVDGVVTSSGLWVDAGAGNDVMKGGSGRDTLSGGLGNDTIEGNAGNDLLLGGDGNDALYGGDDDDTLAGGLGADTLVGGRDNDTADYSASNAAVNVDLSTGIGTGGHAQGDTYNGIDGIIGSAFNDTLIGFDIESRTGEDIFWNILRGGEGDDFIDGRAGADELFGDGGNDTILGGSGTDVMFGGTGRDSLVAGEGGDTVFGGAGADTIIGNDGADSLLGDEGDDTFIVGAGDTANGGAGDDVFNVDRTLPGTAVITVIGGETIEENVIDPTNNPGGRIGDVLDLRNVDLVSLVYNQAPLDPTWNGTTSESGTAVFRNSLGQLVTLNFREIEHVLTNRDGIVDGTAGNDTMPIGYVDAQGDQIDGDDGLNDTIRAGAGNDTVDAGVGNDSVDAGEGNDSVFGNNGDDRIEGQAGNDTLSGGQGNDTLDGGPDNDSLSGGIGNDVLLGGDGSDTLDGGADDDSLSGGGGRDSLAGGGGNDTLDGGADADTLDGLTGNDVLFGGLGNDFMQGGTGNDTLFGGENDDTLEGNADNDMLYGGAGNDSVLGVDGSDYAEGGEGNDFINTRKSAPALPDAGFPGYVYPGTGITVPFIPVDPNPFDDLDTVFGGAGNDTILTGDDADYVDGGLGNDSIDAGIDNDTVLGGEGNDTIVGGEGRDSILGGAGDDLINGGDPTVPEGDIPDELGDPLRFNNADTLFGGTGNDTIFGGDDGDILSGDDGNDSLDGGVDNDTVLGGAGNDALEGGQGDDLLYGDSTAYQKPNRFETWPQDISNVVFYFDTNNDGVFDRAVKVDNFPSSGTGTFISNDLDDYYDQLQAFILAQDPSLTNANIVLGVSIKGGVQPTQFFSVNGDTNGPLPDPGPTINTGPGTNPVLQYSAFYQTYNPNANPLIQAPVGSGNDTIHGGVGNDTLFGEGKNDILYGGDGNDSLDGGADRDFLYGGAGNDTMRGGTGPDVFAVQAADLIVDFDALTGIQGTPDASNEDNDFVDLSAFYNEQTLADWNSANPNQQYLNPLDWLRADQADDGILQNAGGVRIQNNGSAVVASQLNRENTGVVCFTAGTRIMTVSGERPIETLEPGDLVLTMDHGYQPIRWIGSTTVEAKGNLAPIVIEEGVLGNSRTLRVSPQHRMLLSGWQAELLYDTAEVLAPAKALINDQSIRREEGGTVEYFHMLFDVHEIVYAEGAPSESFHPGEQGWGALAEEARAEILQLFPMLEDGDFMAYGPSVRRSLKANEAKLAAELLVRAAAD